MANARSEEAIVIHVEIARWEAQSRSSAGLGRSHELDGRALVKTLGLRILLPTSVETVGGHQLGQPPAPISTRRV